MDLAKLAEASSDELLSLLGLYALPLMLPPDESLDAGRRGDLTSSASEALGQEFHQPRFRELGMRWLRQWKGELAAAICGNDELYREVRKHGLTQLGATVGAISAAIAARHPAMAPYTGLLTILSAFIAQTGLNAFCKMLSELPREDEP